jgi:hypothetical protein
MFSCIIGVEEIEATEIFDYLYESYFVEDFIEQKTYLNGNIYINPESYKKDENKELAFWHLTTREKQYTKREGKKFVTYKERLLDIDRADRLEWVKKIIENHTLPDIKCFYKKETTNKKPIRLYLWLHEKNFVVILQKLGKSSSFLVTSFYIDHEDKKVDYQDYYENYTNGLDIDLAGCEWF